MSPRIRRAWIAAVLFLVAWSVSTSVQALNTLTHSQVNIEAVRQSVYLNAHLQDSLGFRDGRLQALLSNGERLRIEEWIARGGIREDDLQRSVFHFHDPLKPWHDAGLDLKVQRFASSIRWMQDRDQGGILAANWSWHDARRLYYSALIEADPIWREALWADVFRALGQIMHLVVDASVPEHARNDIHPLGGISPRGSYEYWVSNEHNGPSREAQFIAKYLQAPIGFIGDILRMPPPADEDVARIPVSRLIDADRYDGSNPQVTVHPSDPRAPAAAGLAEVANANFFSESTLRRQYPHPTDAGLVPVVLPTPAGRVRRYFARPPGLGLLPASPLRAECAAESYYLRGYLHEPAPYPCVDAAVWREVATHMLPRAVGYARGVLEYFFRGRLQVQTWRMRLGVPFIQIDNLTGEEMNGVFEIFGRPDSPTSGEGRDQTAVVNGGSPAAIAPYGSVTLPVTYLRPEHPTPHQMLVFRGRIGLEEDAVAARVFSVPHVVVVQTEHTAELREQCTTTFEYPYHVERETCGWRPMQLTTEGELLTGLSATVIERVAVTSPFPGTEFVLDGVPVLSGGWERRGDEPDPRRFSVRWSPLTFSVVTPIVPTLTIRLMDGTTTTSKLYGSIIADADAQKNYTFSPAGSDPPWYVAARRSASVQVSPLTSYRLVSIAGYPNPTYISIDRYAVPSLVETLEVDDTVRGDIVGYLQRWTDHATVYRTAPQGGPVLLQKPLREEFEALSYGPVPRIPIEAVLERVNRPGELDFLRAFVTKEAPPTTLTVVGRRPSAP